jgi:hypothetical protein
MPNFLTLTIIVTFSLFISPLFPNSDTHFFINFLNIIFTFLWVQNHFPPEIASSLLEMRHHFKLLLLIVIALILFLHLNSKRNHHLLALISLARVIGLWWKSREFKKSGDMTIYQLCQIECVAVAGLSGQSRTRVEGIENPFRTSLSETALWRKENQLNGRN